VLNSVGQSLNVVVHGAVDDSEGVTNRVGSFGLSNSHEHNLLASHSLSTELTEVGQYSTRLGNGSVTLITCHSLDSAGLGLLARRDKPPFRINVEWKGNLLVICYVGGPMFSLRHWKVRRCR
jgi:hypothetical protein